MDRGLRVNESVYRVLPRDVLGVYAYSYMHTAGGKQQGSQHGNSKPIISSNKTKVRPVVSTNHTFRVRFLKRSPRASLHEQRKARDQPAARGLRPQRRQRAMLTERVNASGRKSVVWWVVWRGEGPVGFIF